jgi:hypothetical protein
MLLIYAVGRFILGAKGVPYAPRGNAVFSVVGLTAISCVYFGALSRRVGGFNWAGTALVGYSLGLFAQILIFTATLISYLAHIETSYFRHWDALQAPVDSVVPMGTALATRAQALVVAPVASTVVACIGRLLSALAPEPASR